MNLVLIKLDSRDKVYFVYTERIIKTEQTKSEAGKKKENSMEGRSRKKCPY